MFTVPSGTSTVPLVFPPTRGTAIGSTAVGVPVVAFTSASDFRQYVSACPDANYAWRFYGKLRIATAGDYTLCTTSDDGSLLYMDLTPNGAGLHFSLLTDDDGLHGNQQVHFAASVTSFLPAKSKHTVTMSSFARIPIVIEPCLAGLPAGDPHGSRLFHEGIVAMQRTVPKKV
jgi:hypothetical protein